MLVRKQTCFLLLNSSESLKACFAKVLLFISPRCFTKETQRERERERERDDDETLFKHGVYISKNTALQKSREILIKILKLNLSIYKFIKYTKYNTQ